MAKQLETEIDKLRIKLLLLTGMVEELVQKSLKALRERDGSLAREVIDADESIDLYEVEIEEDCLKVLALHQPVAIDLRYLVGMLKINNDLERVGDLSVSIAKRVLYTSKEESMAIPSTIEGIANKAVITLERSVESLVKMDPEIAREVIILDDEVNDLNRKMYQQVDAAIKEHRRDALMLMNYLRVGHHLERIVDYATNIAEDVIYMIDGTIVRHNPEIYE